MYVVTLNATLIFIHPKNVRRLGAVIATSVINVVAEPVCTNASLESKGMSTLKMNSYPRIRKTIRDVRSGRPGLATELQLPVLPLRFGVAGTHNTAGTPGLSDQSSYPHVVYFLEDEEILREVPPMLPLLSGSVKYPRVAVEIEDRKVVVLLDIGAEVSVLPKQLMIELIGDGSRHFSLGESKTVRPFANPDVKLEGPWCLSTTVCGVKLTHPFYTMDADIPAVVGIDLLAAAKLVIDVMNRCVDSHHHARLEVEPATSDKEGGPVIAWIMRQLLLLLE